MKEKLKKLKWEVFNQFLLIAKLSSLINVEIPDYDEPHFFKNLKIVLET